MSSQMDFAKRMFGKFLFQKLEGEVSSFEREDPESPESFEEQERWAVQSRIDLAKFSRETVR